MALITVPTTYLTRAGDTKSELDKSMREDSEGSTSFAANPDVKNATGGVSLRYAHDSSMSSESVDLPAVSITVDDILRDDFVRPVGYHWYFLRVSYGRAEKFYYDHRDDKKGFLLWMPCQKKVKYDYGKRFERLDPIFKSNLFIYSTYRQVHALTHRSPMTGYDYVDFAFDHTNKNQYGRDNVMIIPFADMKNFIMAEHVHHPWAHVVTEDQIHFRPGGMVRVTGGAFEGVIGRVARVFGQTRVVITIKGILKYATAYISPKNLVPIDEELRNDRLDKATHSPARELAASNARRVALAKKEINAKH